jgi:hypothetical protein
LGCVCNLFLFFQGGYQQALEHLEKAIQMEDGLNMFAVVNVILLYRKLNQPAFELGILKYIMQVSFKLIFRRNPSSIH